MTIVLNPSATDTATETLRLVELTPGGEPVVVNDLQDEARYIRVRDTFTVQAPVKQSRLVALGGRYGGQRSVGERQDNGQVSATWFARGATPNAAVANVEQLLAEVDHTARGRFLEWRPDGASRSVLYEIRGPGTWAPKYRRIVFGQTRGMECEVSWPVAPLARGLPMDIDERFETLDNWTVDMGAPAAVDGALVPAVGETRMRHTGRGYAVSDVQVIVEYRIDDGLETSDLLGGAVLQQTGPGDFVCAHVTGGRLEIWRFVGGEGIRLAFSASAVNFAANTTYWLVFRAESAQAKDPTAGDKLIAEHWNGPPHPIPSVFDGTPLPLQTVSTTVPSVSGDVGLRCVLAGPDIPRVLRFESKPYTYFCKTGAAERQMPLTLDLASEIPGSAPALADIDISCAGGAWAAVAWSPRPTPQEGRSPALGRLRPQDVDLESLQGWELISNASNPPTHLLSDSTPSGDQVYEAIWPVDTSGLEPDPFGEELTVEVWARVHLTGQLVSPRLAVSARQSALGGAERFTAEWGPRGRPLVRPTGGSAVLRTTRLGTLTIPPDVQWELRLTGALGPGSAGVVWRVEHLTVLPLRKRLCSPSGKPLDPSYPRFARLGAGRVRRVIASDLRGSTALLDIAGPLVPDIGLSGADSIEIAPGPTNLVVDMRGFVPDDPTINEASDTYGSNAVVHLAVTPRYRLARPE